MVPSGKHNSLQTKRFVIFISVIITALALLLMFHSPAKNEPYTDLSSDFSRHEYKIRAVALPENIDFADEKVPLEVFYVKEQLDWELMVNTYWHSSTLLMLKLSKRWFPVIEPILKKHRIPEDFKYVALIESGLKNIISPAGAVGFWQILKGTGRDYGLEINAEVDERYHVEKSTEMACRYLSDAYIKFQNWTLVAASYNAGMNGIEKLLAEQKADNYYDLHLNEETSRYIFRILALKNIFSKPEACGFHLNQEDYYSHIHYDSVQINTPIVNWAVFAEEQKISYRMLKELNPWIRKNSLSNKQKKTYYIKIPKAVVAKN